MSESILRNAEWLLFVGILANQTEAATAPRMRCDRLWPCQNGRRATAA